MIPFKDIQEILNHIYSILPSTTCHKTSCANWCCTKLEFSMDEQGNFMPLPLLYGIEYQNILKYLKYKFPDKKIHTMFDFSKKSKLCPFKDQNSYQCMIYPVRPFSCRIFGRKVPPVFWGVEIDPEQALSIYCKDMSVDEQEKQAVFLEKYPALWTQLMELSLTYSPFKPWQKKLLNQMLEIPDIIILAFGEFYFLTSQQKKWYLKHIVNYWNIMGNLL